MITGSLTYAKALQSAWQHVHRVYWANEGLIPGERRGLVLNLSGALFPGILINAFHLAQFVRQKQIQLIHAHSRRANLVAAIASRLARIPYVVTAHMRTRARQANSLWPCWGVQTIAICETVDMHLREVNHVAPQQIHLIRNGIDMDWYSPETSSIVKTLPAKTRWITILGRLSGKRWKAARFILSLIPVVARAFPDVRFRFVGWVDPAHDAELRQKIRRCQEDFQRPVIEVTQHVEDPRPYLRQSVLVLGAGRSLMEAMAMEIPVIAVGEQADYGLLTPGNFATAQQTNFGDFPRPGEEGFHATPVVQGISAILQGTVDIPALKRWGRERIAADYGLPTIAGRIENLYTSIATDGKK